MAPGAAAWWAGPGWELDPADRGETGQCVVEPPILVLELGDTVLHLLEDRAEGRAHLGGSLRPVFDSALQVVLAALMSRGRPG